MNFINIKKARDEKGFTIVELLIVIVIIGILAAITIVAYNGIQNRGKTAAAQSAAGTLAKKAETYYAENSQYPNVAGTITGVGLQNGVTTSSSSSWYSAQDGAFTTLASTTSAPTAPSDAKGVYYVPNSTNGGCIYWYDYAAAGFKNIQVGTATCVATPIAGTVTNAVRI